MKCGTRQQGTSERPEPSNSIEAKGQATRGLAKSDGSWTWKCSWKKYQVDDKPFVSLVLFCHQTVLSDGEYGGYICPRHSGTGAVRGD